MADLAIRIEQMKAMKQSRLRGNEDIVSSNDVEMMPQVEKPLQLAVLGRQNVGKSTLVNSLVKHERVLSGPIPGLTRDAITVDHDWDGKEVQIVRCGFLLTNMCFSLSFRVCLAMLGRYSGYQKILEAC